VHAQHLYDDVELTLPREADSWLGMTRGHMWTGIFGPILLSNAAPGRRAWLYEYFKEFPYNVPELHAVRTESHLYAEYQGRKPPELFDVVRDPREMRNLMGTSEGEQLLPGLKKMLEGLKAGKRF
jgi:hypothetical protein